MVAVDHDGDDCSSVDAADAKPLPGDHDDAASGDSSLGSDRADRLRGGHLGAGSVGAP